MTTETSIYEYARKNSDNLPSKIAIWYKGGGITYRDLFEKIDNLADHLYAMGVREGTVVTITISNCPEAIISIYAVAKLGAICGMVHPLIPVKDIISYMEYAESKYIITDQDVVISSVTTIRLELFCEFCKPTISKAIIPSQERLATNCAVYIQSSGTTGDSKIAMLTHKAINSYIVNITQFFDDEMSSLVGLSVAPFFHLIGFSFDIHRTLSTGAQIVLMERWDCSEAVKLIKQYKITLLDGVPRMFQELLENDDFSGKEISHIRYCYMGGDNIPESLVNELDCRVGNRVAFAVYGMTELGAGVCTLSRIYYRDGASGYPLKNAVIRIKEPDGKYAKSGTGELICSSESMMTGYLNNVEATEEIMFLDDGRMWIRTGDYGRVDEDGFVYFICRLKNLIIHNGYNIVPKDVEDVIRLVPAVENVCVFGVTTDCGTEDIIAAVVVDYDRASEENIAIEQITETCKKHLPKYAHPHKILIMHDFPRNTMDKIDLEAMKKLV